MMKNVILVDESDHEVGTAEKLAAHQQGLLHRAFSIFIFNTKSEILIQKRAEGKYHSGGLWTNTCCSHPQSGKILQKDAEDRLKEEMGLDADLSEIFTFQYKTDFANGLIENELDHVLVGFSDDEPKPDREEASAWRWISPTDLKSEIAANPADFTEWLKVIISMHFDEIIKHLPARK